MKQTGVSLTVSLCFLMGVGALVYAAGNGPPLRGIPFQGKLERSGALVGVGTSENVTAHFELYDDATAGSLLWEASTELEIIDGVFSHTLGSTVALPDAIYRAAGLFLQVTVEDADGAHLLAGRQQIFAAPQATRAGYALDLGVEGTINFASGVRQHLNLYDTDYGIGVQSSTLYTRSPSNFAWFGGGAHADAALDPGPGGTTQMSLSSAGDLSVRATVSAPNVEATNVAATNVVTNSLRLNDGPIHDGVAPATGDMGLYQSTQNAYMRFVTRNGQIHFFSDGATNPVGGTPNLSVYPSGDVVARGALGFSAQKICVSHAPGNFLTSQMVPQGWSNATCASFATTLAAANYARGCIFTDSFSIGSYGVPGSLNAGLPASNCGW